MADEEMTVHGRRCCRGGVHVRPGCERRGGRQPELVSSWRSVPRPGGGGRRDEAVNHSASMWSRKGASPGLRQAQASCRGFTSRFRLLCS